MFADAVTHLTPAMRKLVNFSEARSLLECNCINFMVNNVFLESSSHSYEEAHNFLAPLMKFILHYHLEIDL